jgi:multiple sugar transport system ATP-binding protein
LVFVRLENVTKKFGDTIAVNNVNLYVRDREFFVLLGPTGCGKSTILNMIAGLEPVTAGNIYFDDRPVNDVPPEKRDVAMVFQSFALYPMMNVFDNIAFPLRVRKYPKSEIQRRVREVAEMLRIAHLLKKKPHELSGGEKQRVALARAIVREPKVFLFDEPLSNIDAKLRVYMRAELIRLQKDLQTTTIFVTHDQLEAMTMGDRIAVMDAGRIMQVGEPLEVFRKPANLFVAGFIGTPPMNFIEGSLVIEGDKVKLDCGHFRLELDEKYSDLIRKTSHDSELVLGIRPHDLEIYKEKPVKSHFEAEVFAVEPVGTETIVNVKVGDNVYKIITSPDFTARIAEKVYVAIDVDKIYLFEKKSGLALS